MTAPTWTNIGNVPKFVVSPKMEWKKHYSSQFGTKRLDLLAATSKELEVEITLDEVTGANFLYSLLVTTATTTNPDYFGASGATYYDLLKASPTPIAVQLVGTNDYGHKCTVFLPSVVFKIDKPLDFIGDDFMSQVITGQVLSVGDSPPSTLGTFGAVYLNTIAGSSPNPLYYFIGKGQVSTAPALTSVVY